MKYLFFLPLLLPFICEAQKPDCKHVHKTIDKSKNSTTWKGRDYNNLEVIRQTGADSFFVIHIHFKTDKEEFNANGIVLELSDGSLIKDENAKITCQEEGAIIAAGNSSNTSAVYSGKYIVQAFLHITQDNIVKLTTQKIIKVHLHNATRLIREKEAAHVIQDIFCLEGKE